MQGLSKEKPCGMNEYVLKRLFPHLSEIDFWQKNLGQWCQGESAWLQPLAWPGAFRWGSEVEVAVLNWSVWSSAVCVLFS